MAEGRFTQQNFNVFKQDRQKEIITFLNEKKINLDTRITLVEISTFLDTMAGGRYNDTIKNEIFASLRAKRTQIDNKLSLIDVIDIILEKEYSIWQQFEMLETNINENNMKVFELSQQLNRYKKEEAQESSRKNNVLAKKGIITIEILDYSSSDGFDLNRNDSSILTISTEKHQEHINLDNFSQKRSAVEASATKVMIPKSYNFEIKHLDEKINFSIEKFTFSGAAKSRDIPKAQLKARDFEDQKRHETNLEFRNQTGGLEAKLKVSVKFFYSMVRKIEDEIAALKENEKEFLQEKSKLEETMQNLLQPFNFERKTLRPSLKYGENPAMLRFSFVGGAAISSNTDAKLNMDISNQEAFPNVLAFTLVFLILSTISCFKRANFIDISIGCIFIFHYLTQLHDLKTRLIKYYCIFLAMSMLYDIGWFFTQFIVERTEDSQELYNPETKLTKVIWIVSFSNCIIKMIALVLYLRMSRK